MVGLSVSPLGTTLNTSLQDIDCMPLNPFDNMPEALRRHGFSVMSKELQVNGHSHIGGFTSTRHLDNSEIPMNTLVKRAQVKIIVSNVSLL